MTQDDLDRIEQELSINLPEIYVKTMLDHPFYEYRFGMNGVLLQSRAQDVLECWQCRR